MMDIIQTIFAKFAAIHAAGGVFGPAQLFALIKCLPAQSETPHKLISSLTTVIDTTDDYEPKMTILSVAIFYRYRCERSFELLLLCAEKQARAASNQGHCKLAVPRDEQTVEGADPPEFFGLGGFLKRFFWLKQSAVHGRFDQECFLETYLWLSKTTTLGPFDRFLIRKLMACCSELAVLYAPAALVELCRRPDLGADYSATGQIVSAQRTGNREAISIIDANKGALDSVAHSHSSGSGCAGTSKIEPAKGLIVGVEPASEDDLFVFVHQNHTGGASLSHAISEAVGKDKSLTASDPKVTENVVEKAMASLEANPQIRFISDHHLVVPTTLEGRNIRRFTMLKHPVARMISCYFRMVICRKLDLSHIPKSIKEDRGLEFFVDEIADTGVYPGGLRPLHYLAQVKDHNGENRYLLDEYATYDDYVRHLRRHFEFIGINEFYDESLFCIAVIMDLKMLPLWKVLHNSGRPSLYAIRPQIISKIERLISDDLTIYEWARQTFSTRFAGAADYFQRNIGNLRMPEDSGERGKLRVIKEFRARHGVIPGDFTSADHGLI